MAYMECLGYVSLIVHRRNLNTHTYLCFPLEKECAGLKVLSFATPESNRNPLILEKTDCHMQAALCSLAININHLDLLNKTNPLKLYYRSTSKVPVRFIALRSETPSAADPAARPFDPKTVCHAHGMTRRHSSRLLVERFRIQRLVNRVLQEVHVAGPILPRWTIYAQAGLLAHLLRWLDPPNHPLQGLRDLWGMGDVSSNLLQFGVT